MAMEKREISERRACRAVGQARSSQRYVVIKREDLTRLSEQSDRLGITLQLCSDALNLYEITDISHVTEALETLTNDAWSLNAELKAYCNAIEKQDL